MIVKIRWGMALGLPVVAFGLWGFLVAQEPSRGRGPGSPDNLPAKTGQDFKGGKSQGNREGRGSGRPMDPKAGPPAHRGSKGPGGPGDPRGMHSKSKSPWGWGGPGMMPKGPMGGPRVAAFAFKKIEPVQPDKDVAAWIKVLADKMTDRHDQIRESARKALIDLGPSAILPLRELTKSSDTATAIAATNILKRIEGPGKDFLKLNPMIHGKTQFQIRIEGAQGKPGEPKKMEVPLPGGGKARIEIRKVETIEKKSDSTPKAPDRRKEEPKSKEPSRPEVKKDSVNGGPFRAEKMLEGLQLEAGKRKQVEDIFSSHQQRMREFMEKNRAASAEDREKLIPQAREMQEGLMKALREVLSEEQFQSLRNNAPGLGRPFNKGEKVGSKE